MLRAPQYRRRRHSRRRLFLAKQIAITYLKPGSRETVKPPWQKGYSKQFSLEHAARMMTTEAQAPACACCGEDASTLFEAVAMIYTSGERPLCDTCWKTQGAESARGKIGWMYYRYHRKNLLEEEETI